MYASRERLEENELRLLAPYAVKSRESRGRVYAEVEHPYRTAFQRDRERIIHTTAFRRLEYKTQVFVNYEGDHYRTRLTHTLETAQIARSVARALMLNEDLTEAVALAHDLGHTPFGHAGEIALHAVMEGHGGFNHNSQSLRLVEHLEQRYPAFPGLNLTWEVREGIIKHTTEYDASEAEGYEPALRATLEAQVVNAADEIAFNAHDVDDGLRSGLIEPAELAQVGIWAEVCARAGISPDARDEMGWRCAVRELINAEVSDLVENSGRALQAHGIDTPEAARRHPRSLVVFSPGMDQMNSELRAFLQTSLYRHYRVVRMAVKAQRLLTELFDTYVQEPSQLPDPIQARLRECEPYRVVCDYVAGMTDRFALEEYRRLFDPEVRT
ncbi:MAG: deoxyguanosinetriphosphate triphosphohydrolase [Anaerolineae bacterium]|nr:deoxyguanosinetriphosphate triphosphohydrolase [Anaerolineae bacterium]